ncbi:thymidine phosphorylase [Ensifer adhaerens]|uniref:thymidine phosphorylase n=1 Tax=Ensifer adhaerens TaxID=106592 RepID=UPI001CBEC806|nr:thymidine phosphorylase [Ensifer adhaerens]MBZ7924911.1 thymidine phosphorylase [Ensifer adhaerens]UAX95875.1 thymidine phosphorylase [Ensifer adhaerens]UAY04783.1 thymidine phosphorylase [Ensifer adhaerens]UAY10214.1 thymidine phosphorylase [Ensifer adhaerens]
MLAQEIIRLKRESHTLTRDHIEEFVRGLVDNSWSDAQVGSMAMAMFIRGLREEETTFLTLAMKDSGSALDWSGVGLAGPILDKHSSGGVGDKVSLPLAAIVSACGGYVPMISGRGLGHTGGTLDKLEAIPGYRTTVSADEIRKVMHEAGCAIVGQTAQLVPADRRLYAIRDLTGTVDSLPLITASILSKKLSAGLQGLVMDVKVGNGAFSTKLEDATELAESLVSIAGKAGLPTRAWISDMGQVLGSTCGNALEVREAISLLRNERSEPRLLELVRGLAAEMLLLGNLAPSIPDALRRVDDVIADGAALEKFARMVAALGGPEDFTDNPGAYMPEAPFIVDVVADSDGWLAEVMTRDIGLFVVELGGGRKNADDKIDQRVGLSQVASIGCQLSRGDLIARAHCATVEQAERAQRDLGRLFVLSQTAIDPRPVMIQRFES